LAVSSQSKSDSTNSSVPGAPNRISFAKLREPLEVPGLLDVQTDSFEWLVGSDKWRAKAVDRGDVNPVGGLEEVLAELSPIEDFPGSMSLSFSDPRFDEVKAPSTSAKTRT
jgi:DNA-directed RNA polymerase subunit beta